MPRLLLVVSALLCIAATSAFATFSVANHEATTTRTDVAEQASIARELQAGSPSDLVQVMVSLRHAPAATASEAHAISLEQAALSRQLQALGARELFRARLAYNGIAVAVQRSQIAALAALPAVMAIRPLKPKAPALLTSVRATGAPQSWSPAGETSGQGIVIGIADTGIDYTHATFDGPGTPEAYSSNNPTLIEPGSFPTSKVVGGIDLAGDNYDATTNPLPQPDADPLDCQGHGTTVASASAGLAVERGQAYPGPYSSDLNFEPFSAGPGVAPGASLYAIKIFGCSGGSALLIAAIEHALDPNADGDSSDRLDVLAIAVRDDFGGEDDPDVQAVEQATRAGLVVVAAAGNAGNTFYSLAAPANARGAIAVTALSDGRAAAGVAADSLASFGARGPARGSQLVKPDLAAPGIAIQAALIGGGDATQAVSGTSIAAGHVAGAAALVLQRHPGWSAEWVKATLVTTTRQISNGSQIYPPTLAGAGALAVDRATASDLLAYASNSQGAVGLAFGAPWIATPQWSDSRLLTIVNTSSYDRQVALSSVVANSEDGVSVAPAESSVRVPANGQIEVPVNVAVQAASLGYTPDDFTPLVQFPPNQGPTRHFVAEHSGAITIREQGITRLRLAQLADLLPVDLYIDGTLVLSDVQHGMVTRYVELSPGIHRTQLFPIGARGQGNPLVEQTVSLAAEQPATLVIGGWSAELRSVLLDDRPVSPAANAGIAPQLRVIHAANSSIGALDIYAGGTLLAAGVTPGQASAYVGVSPGQTEIRVTRAGAGPNGRALLSRWLGVLNSQQLDLVICGRSALRLDLTALDSPLRNGASLRVPFLLAPTAASQSRVAEPQPVSLNASSSVTLTISNTGPRNSNQFNLDAVPLLSVFELSATSADEPESTGSSNAADLRYIGVTSDASVTGGPGVAYIYFGLATHGSWSTPSEVLFQIEIDRNSDGIADAMIASIDLGQLLPPPQATDSFVGAFFEPGSAGSWEPTGEWFPVNLLPASVALNTNPHNSNVLFLTAPVDTLDLQQVFRYRVSSYARSAANYGELIDQTPWLEFNLSRPLLSAINRDFNSRPLFFAASGTPVQVVADRAALEARGGGTLLLLHHHNPPQTRAELVQIVP